jgi:hypothetical protein
MFAPAVLGFSTLAVSAHRVVGPLAVSFGLIAAWEVTRGLRWLNLVSGPRVRPRIHVSFLPHTLPR